MRTFDRRELLTNAALLTDEAVRCDYVYTYPPRQAYGELGTGFDIGKALEASIRHDPRLNLYVHFPFCRQICSFCNLYATTSGGHQVFEDYIKCLEAEIVMRAPFLRNSQIRSVYFGGGTPSLFSSELLDRVLQALQRELDFKLDQVPEVAIEVAPDTANTGYLKELRSIGITRINLGLQASSAKELRSIGRKYEISTNEFAVESALATGFQNVCVDLIYGLPDQSDEDWLRSLRWVRNRGPQTVCAYPLTVRQGTRYGALQHEPDPRQQYRRYDMAARELSQAGYHQETHVRWVLPGIGGYKQKQYHWACENLLGFGAGARSYLWEADIRNGYSLHPRKAALIQYESRIRSGCDPVLDGFVMNADERMRKAAILGLIDLDDEDFDATHGLPFHQAFPEEYEALKSSLLIEHRDDNRYVLTDRGVRHRDVIVQVFFSDKVKVATDSYDYGK
jgi:oxygen-independent coproporphyrinogen-3 oxidase